MKYCLQKPSSKIKQRIYDYEKEYFYKWYIKNTRIDLLKDGINI
jgi:hypothetical protein